MRCATRQGMRKRSRLDDEPVPDRVLGHDAGLDEVQQVIGAAGLRARPRQAVAAERLAPDHRAGRRAVDVEVADRRAGDDVRDRARVAAEQPAGQRDRQRVDAIAGLVDVARPARPSAAARRSPRAAAASRAAGPSPRSARHTSPRRGCRSSRSRSRRSARRARRSGARAPGLALDDRRHVGGEVVGRTHLQPGDRARPAARRARRAAPRARARAPPPSTSARRSRRPTRRSPGSPRRGRRRSRR